MLRPELLLKRTTARYDQPFASSSIAGNGAANNSARKFQVSSNYAGAENRRPPENAQTSCDLHRGDVRSRPCAALAWPLLQTKNHSSRGRGFYGLQEFVSRSARG